MYELVDDDNVIQRLLNPHSYTLVDSLRKYLRALHTAVPFRIMRHRSTDLKIGLEIATAMITDLSKAEKVGKISEMVSELPDWASETKKTLRMLSLLFDGPPKPIKEKDREAYYLIKFFGKYLATRGTVVDDIRKMRKKDWRYYILKHGDGYFIPVSYLNSFLSYYANKEKRIVVHTNFNRLLCSFFPHDVIAPAYYIRSDNKSRVAGIFITQRLYDTLRELWKSNDKEEEVIPK